MCSATQMVLPPVPCLRIRPPANLDSPTCISSVRISKGVACRRTRCRRTSVQWYACPSAVSCCAPSTIDGAQGAASMDSGWIVRCGGISLPVAPAADGTVFPSSILGVRRTRSTMLVGRGGNTPSRHTHFRCTFSDTAISHRPSPVARSLRWNPNRQQAARSCPGFAESLAFLCLVVRLDCWVVVVVLSLRTVRCTSSAASRGQSHPPQSN